MAPIKMFVGKLTKAATTIAFTVTSTPKNYNSIRTSSSSSSSTFLPQHHLLPQHLLSPSLSSPPQQQLQQHEQQQQQQQQQQLSTAALSSLCLTKLCQLFHVTPGDNLYLSNHNHNSNDSDGPTNNNGNRGVYLKSPIKEGEIILSIPISSCFRDDEPPGWFNGGGDNNNNNNNNLSSSSNSGGDKSDSSTLDEELHITDYERYNPSAWSSRLAASLLDMELCQDTTKLSAAGISEEDKDLMLGREIWRSTLPDKDILRASLPVHWDEDVLATAKCTALELAVDSAYFARANAVSNLSEELWNALMNNINSKEVDNEMLLERKCNDVLDIALDMETLQRKCHDALDIVQTRACRVERTCEDGVQWGPPLRIIAPIFDFINHGSRGSSLIKGGGEGYANAYFGIENERMCDLHEARLVVRATRDVMEGEEVLIDYGDSARPNWRCLTSYGFVPDHSDEAVDEDQSRDVAELWMNGLRFEVDAQSVPYELVEVAAAQVLLDQALEGNFDDAQEEAELEEEDDDENEDDEEEGLVLSPSVARAIAKRATEAALNLILEPDIDDSEEVWDAPEFVHAMNLAALLRWSQHKVLMAFAENLTLFAASTSEAESY